MRAFDTPRRSTINHWHAHSTVATVVERDGKFLLVYELAEGRQVYNQPAGHLEQGENLVEAARRETLEETGWEVEITGLVSISLYTAPDNGITYHRTTFAARPLHQVPGRKLDTDIIAAQWLTAEEIYARRDQLRSPLVLLAIEGYRTGKLYSLEILQDPSP